LRRELALAMTVVWKKLEQAQRSVGTHRRRSSKFAALFVPGLQFGVWLSGETQQLLMWNRDVASQFARTAGERKCTHKENAHK
jgi:hypothetical protein